MDPDAHLHIDERKYFSNIVGEKRTSEFFVGRIAAREAVNRLTGARPDVISIVPGYLQHPVVRIQGGSSQPIGVSVSHTNRVVAALAFPLSAPMGLDLESFDSLSNVDMADVFTENEKLVLKSSSANSELQLKTVLWSAKESLAKAIGTGFTVEVKVLEIESVEVVRPGILLLKFKNFRKHWAYGFLGFSHVLTVVFLNDGEIDVSGVKSFIDSAGLL
jgi:4'-phosphopantetheinyl transferase EntD